MEPGGEGLRQAEWIAFAGEADLPGRERRHLPAGSYPAEYCGVLCATWSQNNLTHEAIGMAYRNFWDDAAFPTSGRSGRLANADASRMAESPYRCSAPPSSSASSGSRASRLRPRPHRRARRRSATASAARDLGLEIAVDGVGTRAGRAHRQPGFDVQSTPWHARAWFVVASLDARDTLHASAIALDTQLRDEGVS